MLMPWSDGGTSNTLNRQGVESIGAQNRVSPLVSVIIPTKNRAELIRETLDSLVRQTHRPLEIIVIDDGGSDDTKKIAETYPRTIYQWQRGCGISAARNRGLRLSSGSYVQFLDSDDLLESDKLQAQVAYLEAHPQVDIVYGDARYFTTVRPELRAYGLTDYPSMADVGAWIKMRWEEPGEMVHKLLHQNLMPVCCPLSRRRALELIGPWDEMLEANEDWEYWLRGAIRGLRFEFVEMCNALALVRSHSSSVTRQSSRMSHVEFRLNLARRLPAIYRASNYRYGRRAIAGERAATRLRYELALLKESSFDLAVVREMISPRLGKRLNWFRRAREGVPSPSATKQGG